MNFWRLLRAGNATSAGIGAFLASGEVWSVYVTPVLMSASKAVRDYHASKDKPAPWWARIF